jgi:hypothetical protein
VIFFSNTPCNADGLAVGVDGGKSRYCSKRQQLVTHSCRGRLHHIHPSQAIVVILSTESDFLRSVRTGVGAHVAPCLLCAESSYLHSRAAGS